MAATSSEMRRLDSFISASSAAADNVLATHSRPGSRAGPVQHGRSPLAPGEVDPGGGERRRDHPVTIDAVVGEPRRQRVLEIGHRQRVADRAA